MSKTIKINGTDFTKTFTPSGYTVAYIKRLGSNGGQMKDGSYSEDVLALKAKITVTCMPLTDNAQSELLQAMLQTQYPTLYDFDPKEGDYKYIETMAELGEQKYRGFGSDQKEYWTGLVITFEER